MQVLKCRTHRRLQGLTAAALFFCISPMFCQAATYYVAKTGRDRNTCTQAQSQAGAKLTIAAGVACMSGGDTLIIGDGTYVEGVQNIIPGGLPGRPTTIQAQHQNAVIVRPIGPAVLWINHDYITVDGIWWDAIDIYSGGAIYIASSNHIVIKNGKASNGHGIVSSSSCIVGDGNNDIQILNMEIYGCSTGTIQDHGIYAHGTNWLIEGNDIHHNGSFGIHGYPSASGTIVRNNKIHANKLRGVILLGDNTQFYNNTVYDNGWGVIVGAGTNIAVYNNTIHNNAGPYCIWIGEENTGATNARVQNNICLANSENSVKNDGRGSIIERNLCAAGCDAIR